MRFGYETHVAHRPGVGLYALSRPHVPIRVIGPSGHVDLIGLVDTGSTDTLIPIAYLDILEVPQIFQDDVSGIGGNVNAHFGRVNLEITYRGQVLRWMAWAGFYAGNRTLLGHNGFL